MASWKDLKNAGKDIGKGIGKGADKAAKASEKFAEKTVEGVEKGVKTTASVAEKSWDTTKEFAKNTTTTTQQVGGGLANFVSGNMPWWQKFPIVMVVYVLAFIIGISLAMAGSNSKDFVQGSLQLACEIVTNRDYPAACRCSYSACAQGYPDECRDVTANRNVCSQIANSSGEQSIVSCPDAFGNRDLSFSLQAIGNQGLIGFTYEDNFGALSDFMNQWSLEKDDFRVVLDDIPYTPSMIDYDNNFLKFRGKPLIGVYSNRNLSVALQAPFYPYLLTALDCSASNNLQSCLAPEWCTLYSSAVPSGSVSQLAENITITFTADQTSIQFGQCTKLRWTIDGDVHNLGEDDFALNTDFDGNGEFDHDIALAGSQSICPENTIKAALWVNGSQQFYEKYVQVVVLSSGSQDPEDSEAELGGGDNSGEELAVGSPTLTVSQNTLCRKGPGSEYAPIGDLQVGEETAILGLFADGDYYVIENFGVGGSCWIYGGYASVHGNTSNLPYWDAPAPPVVQEPEDSSGDAGEESVGPQPESITFTFSNLLTNAIVTEVYVKPAGSSSWGGNLISSQICDGESQSITIPNDGASYDLRVTIGTGGGCGAGEIGGFDTVEEYDLPLSQGSNYPFKPY
jgi:hypothetical protein